MLRICSSFCLVALLCAAAPAEDNSFPSPVTWKPDERAVSSGLYIQPHAAARKEKVEFTIAEPAGVARKSYPVRGSVPLFRGELADASKVRLVNAAGKEVPVQAKITGFWPEKTARFLCLDFLIDIAANEEQKFILEYGSEVKTAAAPMKPTAAENKSADVNSGNVSFSFKAGNEFLVVTPAKQKALKPVTGTAVICADEKGGNPTKLPLIIDEVTVTEQGPVQTTVHLMGHYGSDKSGPPPQKQFETWKYPASLYFRIYANTGHCYVEHCFGYNADEYKEFVQSYGLTIPTGLAKGKFSYGSDDNAAAESALGVRLNQFAHNEWELSGKATAKGKRFGGWGAIKEGSNQVLVGMREAWQQWPVAIRADDNGDLTYEIMGEKPDRVLDLRYEDRTKQPTTPIKNHSMFFGDTLGWYYYNEDATGSPGSSARGLMKLHELFIDFSPAAPAQDLVKAFEKPLLPWPGQNRFRDTKVFGHIQVYGDPQYEPMKEYFSVLLSLMPVLHEANGLYGWVDWGDTAMIEKVENGKFKLSMDGGMGWSNGERAVQSFFYHYIAGGGRRFLDIGHSFVHHTIGIDTEHAGGDAWEGGYQRHNQVHWRHWPGTRQGGYRGWHQYYWLTGDPEVARLAILEGIETPSNAYCINIGRGQPEGGVGMDAQHSSGYTLATCCWITTGDWLYARCHHAIARLGQICIEKNQDFVGGWNFYRVDKDGEPQDYQLCAPGTGTLATGYWFTYGGDDQLVDWASLTGDPCAVDSLIGLNARMNTDGLAGYHSPEGFLMGTAFLTHDRKIVGELAHRLPMLGNFDKNRKAQPEYKSADEWANGGGNVMFFKNGQSILGAQAYEFLYWAFASELLVKDPTPDLKMPATAKIPEGKKAAAVEVDASGSKKGANDITTYEWTLDGKAAATGAKPTLQIPEGGHTVGLKISDGKGSYSTVSSPITVWDSKVVYKLGFFGFPGQYVDAHRPFDAQAGFGWAQGGMENFNETGPGYADTDKARGCHCFLATRGGNIYQLKTDPGTYHLEMGGAVTMQESAGTVTLQGKVVYPGVVKNSRGIVWEYNGDVVVEADGLIKISLDILLDDKGKPAIDPLGNSSTQFINYIELKKK